MDSSLSRDRLLEGTVSSKLFLGEFIDFQINIERNPAARPRTPIAAHADRRPDLRRYPAGTLHAYPELNARSASSGGRIYILGPLAIRRGGEFGLNKEEEEMELHRRVLLQLAASSLLTLSLTVPAFADSALLVSTAPDREEKLEAAAKAGG